MSSLLTFRQKLQAGRAMVCARNPYFSVLINSATYVWVERGTLGTMGINDKGVVYIDPAFVEQLTVEQMAIGLLHELAGHWLRDHVGRMPEGADKFLWNLAGDLEFNDDLAPAGWNIDNFPGGICIPSKFDLPDGKMAEYYYNELRKLKAQQQQKQHGQGQGEGQEGGGGIQQPDQPQCGSGWCGSGAGNPLPKEPKDEKDGQGQGGDGDGSSQGSKYEYVEGRGQGAADRMRKTVAKAIQKHEKQNGRGSVPGGWSRWAEDMVQEPAVRWQDLLQRTIRDACAYRPGSLVKNPRQFGRRQAALGFGPGRPMTFAWRNPVPNVAVVIDTSGSMGHDELSIAASETDGILKAVQSEVTFMAIDSQVHACIPIHGVSDLAKHLKGGGGTDFRPAFEELSARRTRPEVVIFITDGCGPAPRVPPAGMKVVWVIVGQYARKPWSDAGEVEYGTFITIPAQGEEAQRDD